MSKFALAPADPAELGFPPTLPIEVAMGEMPIKEIFEAYGLDKNDYLRLKHDPLFTQAVVDARKLLQKEGMTFKMKARMQAEELLKTSWSLIHSPTDEVPAHVKADLIKFTVKAAGLDASLDQKAAAAAAGAATTALQININLD